MNFLEKVPKNRVNMLDLFCPTEKFVFLFFPGSFPFVESLSWVSVITTKKLSFITDVVRAFQQKKFLVSVQVRAGHLADSRIS